MADSLKCIKNNSIKERQKKNRMRKEMGITLDTTAITIVVYIDFGRC